MFEFCEHCGEIIGAHIGLYKWSDRFVTDLTSTATFPWSITATVEIMDIIKIGFCRGVYKRCKTNGVNTILVRL